MSELSFVTKKRLTILNILTTIYFLGVYIVWVAQIKFVLIGVFVELLTLPLIVLQVFGMVKSIHVLGGTKLKVDALLLSTLLVVTCQVLIVLSFVC